MIYHDFMNGGEIYRHGFNGTITIAGHFPQIRLYIINVNAPDPQPPHAKSPTPPPHKKIRC